MSKINNILIIIQRSNGDVFLSISLIKKLYEYYDSPKIDLLVNDDTFSVASLIPYVKRIHTFSYQRRHKNRWGQEFEIIKKIFRNYDLSINLTSSDRSVIYAILSSKKSISVVEKNNNKSWWKKKLLSHFYFYDSNYHILVQNLTSLDLLNIKFEFIQNSINISDRAFNSVKTKLAKLEISNFIIFHPSAQYKYKILPKHLRNDLLFQLSKFNIPIIVTGTNNKIDLEIKRDLPLFNNIFNFIGETSLEEYFALSELSLAYIGMDTLNMHIAASQNKRIFAIFGPTNLKMWSPWSNELKISASFDMPFQTYSNVSIFQANMPCVACGKAGCNNSGQSQCIEKINLQKVSEEVLSWVGNVKF